MFKLKEKLQQFITNKSQIYANIDLNETLNRNPAKQRATWNSDSSKFVTRIKGNLLKIKLFGCIFKGSKWMFIHIC